MSEDWKLQASYKVGDTMVNVRAGSAFELKTTLDELSSVDALADITTTGDLLKALTNVGAVTAAPAAPAAAPPAAPTDQWGAPAAPPPPAPAAAPTAAPGCPHGTRVFRSGAGAKGPWQAWMCPAQKEDPSKCQPQWIR